MAGREDLYEYCIKQRRSCYEARAPQPLYKQNRVQPAAAAHQNRPGPGAPRRAGALRVHSYSRDTGRGNSGGGGSGAPLRSGTRARLPPPPPSPY